MQWVFDAAAEDRRWRDRLPPRRFVREEAVRLVRQGGLSFTEAARTPAART